VLRSEFERTRCAGQVRFRGLVDSAGGHPAPAVPADEFGAPPRRSAGLLRASTHAHHPGYPSRSKSATPSSLRRLIGAPRLFFCFYFDSDSATETPFRAGHAGSASRPHLGEAAGLRRGCEAVVGSAASRPGGGAHVHGAQRLSAAPPQHARPGPAARARGWRLVWVGSFRRSRESSRSNSGRA